MQKAAEKTLWKDLVEIPRDQDTFVLDLNAGLDEREQTVRDYVVTESLKERFDQALSMIADGLAVGKAGKPDSEGAFLHGSFGSGKSHFMAVLNLVLEGYGEARDLERLRDVVVEHPWMDDVSLLMVPFHMLGSRSMESAVLGGYVDYVRKEHPEASIPGVYLADKIIDNAEGLRESMGDDSFFDVLNGASDGESGWGDYGSTDWDLESYQKARKAADSDDEKRRLVGDLVETLFPSVHDAAKLEEGKAGFVDFDEGLSIISKHAEGLGYDGLILFLDELILWLARQAASPEFVSREIQKVSKLVEAKHTDRPAPIFSFIARQRDLSEMIGEEYMGEASQQLALHQESIKGRFHVVELEDRNLPAIAEARLLRPQSSDARMQIDKAFESKMGQLTKTERDIMVTGEYDREAFRQVFPFSPALVETLIVLSNELQRKRTALKIMQLLLIRKRNELEVGDLISVGDLWEVLREGQEPFDPVKKELFRTAKDIDTYKLRPVVHQHYEVDDVDGLDADDPGDAQVLGDIEDDLRLLHTLLISALVPYLDVFENMTPRRLIALNHGTVASPVPGAEVDQLMPKLRKWTTEIQELHLTDKPNQTVELRLEGVDTERLLAQANTQDSHGNRVRKAKQMMYQWLGLNEGRDLRAPFSLEWNGDEYQMDVAFLNVREQPLSRLESDGEHWLLIIDYPFDQGNHNAQDDEKKLDAYRSEKKSGTETLIWLPKFLSTQGQALLGKLIKIEAVLSQFSAYATDLRAEERDIARRQLESNQDTLQERLHMAFRNVYGLGSEEAALVSDEKAVEPLQSLASNYRPSRPPFGQKFSEALEAMAREALSVKYPDAYNLPDTKLTRRQVQKMQEVIREAIDSPEGSVHVEGRQVRKYLRDYAERIDLGVMGDNRFEVKRRWANRFDQNFDAGDQGIDVGAFYELIDPEDKRTGLAKELKDLIVSVVADMENLVVERHGEAVDPAPGKLKPSDRLQQRRMPDEETWETARETARDVFGIRPPQTLGARTVQSLADRLREEAKFGRNEALQVADYIREAGRHLGLSEAQIEESRRYRVAKGLRQLLLALDESDATDILEATANLDLAGDRKAIGRSLERAGDNLKTLDAMKWSIFDNLVERGSERSSGEDIALENGREVLTSAEHSVPLERLEKIQDDLLELLMEKAGKDKDDDGADDDEQDGTETDEQADGDAEQEPAFTAKASEAPERLSRWIDDVLGDSGDDRELEISVTVSDS